MSGAANIITVLSIFTKYSNISSFDMSCHTSVITFASDNILTHWGGETHICVGNLTIIGSDNGLLPERRQAII